MDREITAVVPKISPNLNDLLERLMDGQTIESLQNLLLKVAKKRSCQNHLYTPDSLIDQVCAVTGYSRHYVTGRSRERDVVMVRMCVSGLMFELFRKMPLKEIGWYINRDHATVIHHLKQIDDVKEVAYYFKKVKKSLVI